jgi:hypothetical protein
LGSCDGADPRQRDPHHPTETGWIFGGYFDDKAQVFAQGPYFKVVRSGYSDKQPFPRAGEWIKITSERRIVISDFAFKGLTRRFDPPWQQNVLSESDYTGLTLPKGAVVEVRDVSAGAFPDKPEALWIRIGKTQ